MSKLIERQTIVTWYTPDEKKPEEDVDVVVSVSGQLGNVTYDHALAVASWADDGEGWIFPDNYMLSTFSKHVTIHAWCDLEPYGGSK